jgi:peptidoglycan/LPS O-acetylase OafA/YrhL
MLGYVLYQTRGEKIRLNRTLEVLLWISAVSMFFFLNFSYFYFIQLKDTSRMFLHAISAAFYRVLWSLMVSAIIFACQNGSGGIVRWFLSLKQWQPLGRMGLSIYLVHRVYQIVTTFNEKQPIHWDFFTEMQKTSGDILVSIFFGAALYLTVESPAMLIEKYLHGTFKKQGK